MNIINFDNISKKLKLEDSKRLKWSFWTFLLSLLSLCCIYYYKSVFFFVTSVDAYNYFYRFLWVLPFSFLGFSFLAFIASRGKHTDPPWLSYLFSYFPRLTAFSLIIFSILHIFQSTSVIVYYFLSAGLGLYVGYHVDVVQPEKLLGKL